MMGASDVVYVEKRRGPRTDWAHAHAATGSEKFGVLMSSSFVFIFVLKPVLI